MGKLGRMLDTFCLSSGSDSCFCLNSTDFEDEFERKPLVAAAADQKPRLRDVVSGKQTLAFQLKPKVNNFFPSFVCSTVKFSFLSFFAKASKDIIYPFFIFLVWESLHSICWFELFHWWNMQIVILRVSMQCHGCARKVEKHISKLEGENNATYHIRILSSTSSFRLSTQWPQCLNLD